MLAFAICRIGRQEESSRGTTAREYNDFSFSTSLAYTDLQRR